MEAELLNARSGPRIRQVPSENRPYETITVEKLTPVIGAEIGGIDLSRPLSGLCEAEVRRALAENLVIFSIRPRRMSVGCPS